MGGLIGLATKDKDGLSHKGWNPTRLYSGKVGYFKIASVTAYDGATIYLCSQVAGQSLNYCNYIIQLAGGNNTGTKGSAMIHRLFDNLNKHFYLKPGNNSTSEIYCNITEYEWICTWKPTEGGKIISEYVDSLPSDVIEISPL